MNLTVMPDTWQFTPRYSGYNSMARNGLPSGPDRLLVATCHEIIFTELKLREASRDFVLAEMRGADEQCAGIEAAQAEHLTSLRLRIGEASAMVPRTDLGLVWKSDALVHLVEQFGPDGLAEIVSLAHGYARDVIQRFSGESEDDVLTYVGFAGETSDRTAVSAFQHARDCLARRDAAARRLATLADSLSPLRGGEVGALEEVLDCHERAAIASLESSRYYCPKSPVGMAELAELVFSLLSDGTAVHEDLAVSEFGRNLANGVLTYLGWTLAEAASAGS